MRYSILALLVVVAAASAATARPIDVPLQLDHAFLREALVSKLYTTASGKAVLWDDGSGCGFLKLRDPQITTVGSRVRIVSRGEGRIGQAVGSQCIAPIQWDGFIEVLEEVWLPSDDRQLRFRVVESNLYDSKMKKGLLSAQVWDRVKDNVQPTFENVSIDLADVTKDLRDMLPLVLTGHEALRVSRAVDSLRFVTAAAAESGVHLLLRFDLEPNSSAGGPTPEPTFSSDELARWEAGWERWDGFLTFVIKHVWNDTLFPDLRQPLVDVLLDGRYDILEALAPTGDGAADPVRALFLRSWERLAPVLRQSAARQPGSTALRYFSFATAADALVALDAAGPDIGLDISADGLRRLARILAPEMASDPLDYTTGVDPALRTLFGFGPPLDPPDLSAMPTDDVSWWRGWLSPTTAWAGDDSPPAATLRTWLADRDNITEYLNGVQGILNEAAAAVLARSGLPDKHQSMYRMLVLATAWKESCWRQFVERSGKITFLRSPVGAAGMMQINEKVWRGLYDLRGLRWDIRYNARAGAEIVLRYLSDYAIAKREDSFPGGADNLPRATYAVYNGGPGHLTRYRKPGTKPLLRRIDEGFYEKFQAVRRGKVMDVAKCIIGGD